VLIGAGVLELALYVLRRADVINNWYLLVLTFMVLLLLPVVAQALMPEAFVPEGEERKDEDDVPAEFIGIDRPFTAADRDRLDQALGLQGNGSKVTASAGQAAAEVEL
jgi:hypothetical protein